MLPSAPILSSGVTGPAGGVAVALGIDALIQAEATSRTRGIDVATLAP